MIDLANSELCVVESISTRVEDEEIEVNCLQKQPQLRFRCLAGQYKTKKLSLRVSEEAEYDMEKTFMIGRQ